MKAGETLGVAGSSPAPRTNATYTPDWLAQDMVALCDIKNGNLVLEPSAGFGALAIRARKITPHVHCYELNKTNYTYLIDLGFNVVRGDFLLHEPSDLYHRILMNPPSYDDRYTKHVLHAIRFLLPGGRLVALIVTRFLTGQTADDQEMRKILEDGGRLYQIAHPRFGFLSKNVAAAILVYQKCSKT